MKRSTLIAVFCLWTAFSGLVASAKAQTPIASTTCSAYREAADPAQQALYLAYLQGFANASSPDPRYTQSEAAVADDARRVRDWCAKYPNSSYGEAVYATVGPPRAAAAPQYQPAPVVTPQYSEPTSCRVGPTAYCSGCSVRCSGATQATCKPGKDSSDYYKTCDKQADCSCK